MRVHLILLKAGGSNKSFSLPSSVTIVGRRQDCDMCIQLKVVSRRHCSLNMDDGELSIRDLGSSNGTFVNGERIDEINLSAGDKVSIGPLDFIVQIDGVPTEATIDTPLADVIVSPGSNDSHHDMQNTEIINAPQQ